jgi:type III pantothenate kinase
MLLCIDIGNTNIKLGLFNGDSLCCSWRISTDRNDLADEYAMVLMNLFSTSDVEPSHVTGCAISSVVPALTVEFIDLCNRYFHLTPLVPGPGSDTGIKVNTDLPSEVGMDLVMNALAARHLYGAPVIIVGLGTATTFTAVSSAGVLEGVAIAPGIITSANSLFSATSTLPRVALQRPTTSIGKNTVASLQAGMVYGFSSLIEGLVARMREELGGGAKVVATGGLAPVIATETKAIDFVEPNLALIGLKLMYEMNRGNLS